MNSRFNSMRALTLVSLACLTLVAACGGGGGGSSSTSSTSNTSTTTAQASVRSSGTVTGFGSVVVDGVRIDDSAVISTMLNDDLSTSVNTELTIGQSVEVDHRNKVADRIEIKPVLIGNYDPATTSVLGVPLLVNTDPAVGPVTVFRGLPTNLASIPATPVRVFGALMGNSIVVSRIESPSNPLTYFRVNLPVVSYNALTGELQLEGGIVATTVNLQPSFIRNGTLADLKAGVKVTVSIDAAQPTVLTSGVPQYNVTRLRFDKPAAVREVEQEDLGGLMTDINPIAHTFVVRGTTVSYDPATLQFGPSTSLADLEQAAYATKYVRVEGTYQADGTFLANRLVLRAGESNNGREGSEFHGTVNNINGLGSTFTLRGIVVDFSQAPVDPSCPNGLSNDVAVEVKGQLTVDGVLTASTVKCEEQRDRVSVESKSGQVVSVDPVAKTFILARSGRPSVEVQYNDRTFFVNVTPETLAQSTVEVEGLFVQPPTQDRAFPATLVGAPTQFMVALKVKYED